MSRLKLLMSCGAASSTSRVRFIGLDLGGFGSCISSSLLLYCLSHCLFILFRVYQVSSTAGGLLPTMTTLLEGALRRACGRFAIVVSASDGLGY